MLHSPTVIPLDRPTRAPVTELLPVSERLVGIVPDVERVILEPLIEEIEALKVERNAVVLAHNYMTPDIFHGVADFAGRLAATGPAAAETDADVIVMAGVHFMAETAKIALPRQDRAHPDSRAGCSLAESITGADVRLSGSATPGVPVVTYVNTSAEVKAESDICCTSSNAVKVVESLGVDRVIFLPDQYLGRWVASQTGVEVILWQGSCKCTTLHGVTSSASTAPATRAGDPGPPRVPARRARRGRLRGDPPRHDPTTSRPAGPPRW